MRTLTLSLVPSGIWTTNGHLQIAWWANVLKPDEQSRLEEITFSIPTPDDLALSIERIQDLGGHLASSFGLLEDVLTSVQHMPCLRVVTVEVVNEDDEEPGNAFAWFEAAMPQLFPRLKERDMLHIRPQETPR